MRSTGSIPGQSETSRNVCPAGTLGIGSFPIRIIHVSIANASETSPLSYFHGKALLERALMEFGLSYAILRPAVLFRVEDTLINNIAWTLRRFPVFSVFGDGNYRVQPIHVADLAELAVREGASRENRILNATGPETFTFRELVAATGRAIGRTRPIVSMPPAASYLVAWMIGSWKADILLTRDEIAGLMQNLLYSHSEPTGWTRLTV